MGFNDKHIQEKLRRVEKYLKADAPRLIGTEGVNHFKKSFEDGGFTDDKLSKWKPAKRTDSSSEWYGFHYKARSVPPNSHPKRRGAAIPYRARKRNPITNYSPAATTRRTMIGDASDLIESIEYEVKGNKVRIFSDKPYARVHNEGGKIRVFGKRTVKLPKRQFLGPSKKLKRNIEREIANDVNKILNR